MRSRSEQKIRREKEDQRLFSSPPVWVIEVPHGIEELTRAELKRVFGKEVKFQRGGRENELFVTLQGKYERLLKLRLASSVYLYQHYDIPRPRSLLGDLHLKRLTAQLQKVLTLAPSSRFKSFRFEAAGKDSSVFAQLAQKIEELLPLTHQPEDGELVIRVRHNAVQSETWETLIRISPRPLSTRSWRVVDYPGALNAVIAAAMVEESNPTSKDRVLNLMCGSGTLLIERVKKTQAGLAVGIDSSSEAIAAAVKNTKAAGADHKIEYIEGDVTELPFSDASFDVALSDLPWGELIGSRRGNKDLYDRVLKECHRVLSSDGRAVLLTQHDEALEKAIDSRDWTIEKRYTIKQGGFTPYCYVLHKR